MDADEPQRLAPIPGFWLVLIANVAIYGALVMADGDLSIGVRTLIQWGSLLPEQYMEQEPWRYLTAGFLHFGLVHIVANMICLLAWGVPLERGLGTMKFLLLFVASILGGSLLSVAMHEAPFVGAGASGGTSGLLGALMAQWMLRRLDLPASFFVINIGLNIAVALISPSVDWQAHLGGFLTGLVLSLAMKPRFYPA
ncbi:MAG: hypothetical protein CTY25_08475 [Methylobacterium sp.]|nr:MAG: hypothetical protein CTY25_08475 [Methylobacterium sp.]